MIRYIIAAAVAIIFVVAVISLLKFLKRKPGRIAPVLILIGGLIVFIVMTFFPTENIILTFETPKEAIAYANKEYEDFQIKTTVDGEDSCLLLSDVHDAPQFVRKSESGWKVSSIKYSRYQLQKNCFASVYKIKNTSDYYVSILVYYNESDIVADNKGTDFVIFKGDELSRFYGYVHNMDESYKVTINGKEFELGKEYFG